MQVETEPPQIVSLKLGELLSQNCSFFFR